jgi:hypothetical protein
MREERQRRAVANENCLWGCMMPQAYIGAQCKAASVYHIVCRSQQPLIERSCMSALQGHGVPDALSM